MRRLIFRTSESSYRAFAFEFKDDKDGSFYIETGSATQEDGSGGNVQRVSYHATGRINYKGAINAITYGEPIFAISQLQDLFCVSFASPDKLAKISDSRPDDMVLDLSATTNGRISLYVCITPPDASPRDANTLVITYSDWFTIQFTPGPPPKQDIPLDKNRIVAPNGRFTGQQVGQEQALIFVHQKRTRVKDVILWWEKNTEAHFRVIFATPMRVPPELMVKFAEPNLEAVPLPPRIINTATAELRFRVRGNAGFLSEAPTITEMILDAEFHD